MLSMPVLCSPALHTAHYGPELVLLERVAQALEALGRVGGAHVAVHGALGADVQQPAEQKRAQVA